MRRHNRLSLIAVSFLSLMAALGCNKSEAPSGGAAPTPPPTYAVAEKFDMRPHTYVRSLQVDQDRLFVGTSTGVLEIDRKSYDMVRTFTREDGMRNNYAFVVRRGPNGNIWMGTNAGGLSVWKQDAIHNYLPKHGLADLWIYDVAFQDDTVWLATWDGANRITGNMDEKANWTTFNTGDGLANPWVYAIQIDREGAVWFGTEGGLSRLKDGNWTTWLHKDGMGAENPGNLARSPLSGFGSTRPGEDEKKADAHSHDLTELTTQDGSGAETYNEDYVFSLLLDTAGDLWIGTWGGGVSRFDGKSFVNYSTKDGLTGNVVYGITQTTDGAMWFGTNHGISRFDGHNWSSYTRQNGLIGEDAYTIEADGTAVWAGQKGGVVKLAQKTDSGSPH